MFGCLGCLYNVCMMFGMMFVMFFYCHCEFVMSGCLYDVCMMSKNKGIVLHLNSLTPYYLQANIPLHVYTSGFSTCSHFD